ncbi:MAG: hypothetical protein JXA67_06880, partial [Micromonosporaceae bacterium]|nr:hypothetical protein [Micromonosporaceae bacterium]
GLAALFKGEGAAVVPLDQGRLSPELITQAILASGASEVIVLPNLPMSPEATAETRATGDHGPCRPATGATDPAVDQAVAVARDRGIRATVVPTRSPVQALAALAVHDPSHRFDDDVITMAEAAGGCRHAELIRAAAEALTVVGRCAEGDILALVDGEVNLIGQSVLDVGLQLLDRLLTAGGELVTLVTGQDAPKGTSQALAAHLRERWPFVDVQWYVGNQPDSPLLIGVE